jgi:MFS superfamily sulfate permease-like transporter
MMALVSGAICVAAGLARLGFVTELLSKPIRYGYMNGIALTVLLSQIPKLCGFSVNGEGPLRQMWGIVQKAYAGDTNHFALGVGIGTLAIILVLKRWPRVPGILIAVGAATAAVGGVESSAACRGCCPGRAAARLAYATDAAGVYE